MELTDTNRPRACFLFYEDVTRPLWGFLRYGRGTLLFNLIVFSWLLVECFGGHSGGEIPGYIPNPEVKPSSADGTALGTVWEIRTLPDYVFGGGFLVCLGTPHLFYFHDHLPNRTGAVVKVLAVARISTGDPPARGALEQTTGGSGRARRVWARARASGGRRRNMNPGPRGDARRAAMRAAARQ